MKNNTFKKEYIAVLDGILSKTSGTISAPIARKPNSIIERCVNFEHGENAITHYNVMKYQGTVHCAPTSNLSYSLVHFILETGRTHQIRVHSAYIGHPIIGDTLYGKSSNLINRQALHAHKVSFIHPITKKEMILEAKLPEDMSIFF